MAKLKILAVIYDGQQPFRAGQMLTGNVCFRLTGSGSIFVAYLNLFFYGVCKVKWEVGNDHNKRTYKSKEVYLAEDVLLLLPGGKEFTAGSHQIRFQFLIPNNVPSSLSTSHGNITYSVTCNAKCDSNKHSLVSDFTVLNPVYIHLNTTATELANRSSLVQEKQKGYSCCGFVSYKLDFNLTLRKSAYESGERVIIDGDVLNRSSHVMQGLSITLLQEITFFGTKNGKLRGKRKWMTRTSKIIHWKGKNIGPGKKAVFQSTPTIMIPSVPATGCRFCSNIKISYFLLFSVSTSEALPTKVRCSLRELFIGNNSSDADCCISVARVEPPAVGSPPPQHDAEDEFEAPPPSYESAMANSVPPPQFFLHPQATETWIFQGGTLQGTQF